MAPWSARNNTLPAIKISHPRLSACGWINIFARKVRKPLQLLNIGISFCRYQSALSLYSLKRDNKLYTGISTCINVGSGGFSHHRWKNYDYQAVTPYYKALQGVAHKDFVPIDLTDDINVITERRIDCAYISHTLEHLPSSVGKHLLHFLFLRLKPGGVIRLAVPNHESAYQDIKLSIVQDGQAHTDYIYEMAVHMLSRCNNMPKSLMREAFESSQTVDQFFLMLSAVSNDLTVFRGSNPEHHISLWTHSTFKEVCLGLEHCNLRFFGQGKSDYLPFTNNIVFDTTEPAHSLYIEISKLVN